MTIYISELEEKLIISMSERLYTMFPGKIITKEDIETAQKDLQTAGDKITLCLALEAIHYSFSVILTEVRQIKRAILASIFEIKPKLAEEKSVLEKKLDAEPEYAKYKQIEEYMFQFLEHIETTRSTIYWLIKEEEEQTMQR